MIPFLIFERTIPMLIDGVEYVRKDMHEGVIRDGMQYCIVRTESAGVFAGYVASRNGNEAELIDSRRIWYWSGAASLSELAVRGTSAPGECKFPCVVPQETVFGVIEIIPCTGAACDSIKGVKEWTQH